MRWRMCNASQTRNASDSRGNCASRRPPGGGRRSSGGDDRDVAAGDDCFPFPASRFPEDSGIPALRMPETAIELFHHISKYYRNQKLLLQTPEPTRQHGRPEAEGARMLIEALLAERRQVLSEMESKAILRAFRVPVAQTMVARTATEALLLAEQIGFPVAMKVDSPDLTHKTDAGGVRLNIMNAPAVRNAYHDIIDTVQKRHPNARINGVSIEPFLHRPHGRRCLPRAGLLRPQSPAGLLEPGAALHAHPGLDRLIA